MLISSWWSIKKDTVLAAGVGLRGGTLITPSSEIKVTVSSLLKALLSRTQVLLTKIVKLCLEIRDIKHSQNKYNLCGKGNTRNKETNLSKISDTHRNHNPVSLDICVYHDQHDDDSSHNIPSSPSHPACRKGTALPCEPLPSHTQSSPVPLEGGVPHMSPQLSSSLEEDTSSSVGASSEDALSAGEG